MLFEDLSDDYTVVRSRMSSTKWEFLTIRKNDPDVNGKQQTKPSAHQARTGSLVRRNLKYDEDWKNYCQSNVGDVLRIHVNKDIFRSSRLNTFLISSILFFIFSHLNNARFDSSLLHITALAAIGHCTSCGTKNRCVFWSERVSANLMFC